MKKRYINSLSIALILFVLMTITIASSQSIEIRGLVAEDNRSRSWNGATFQGLYYDIDANEKPEILSITSTSKINNRLIQAGTLFYDTYKIQRTLKVVENGHGSELFDKFPDGKYYFVSWLGEPHIPINAINGKIYKLSKLIIEQGNSIVEKKTLIAGESWNVGGGWILKAKDIDAKSSPRKVLFSLSKDCIELNESVVEQGKTYVYTRYIDEKPDVPLFVTYVDSIFAGATTDMVQVRYTWAISDSLSYIRAGDRYGVFKVKSIDKNHVQLYNKDVSIYLSKGATIDIAYNLKFRVANNDTLRYYPVQVKQIVPESGGGCGEEKNKLPKEINIPQY